MEDITKTGNQTYRDLQEENAGPYKKTTYDPNDFPKLTGKQAMRAYAPTEHTTSITDYAADLGYGESRFDKHVASLYQLENLQDVRGYNQPWYAQIGAGIAKGAVLAGTTFLDGTVGLVYGLASIPANGISGLWDNTFSNTMQEINQAMEKVLPNYRTQEEQSRKWYQNLGTANFWGDSFLKNMGFTVGAFYSGGAWNGAFKALGILKRGITAQAVGSFLSAFNEGRIEANNGQREFLKLENLKINDAYNKRRDEILNSNLSDKDKTTLLQQTADEAKLMYDEAKERAHVMGLTTLIGNTALLTFGNLIQFGKLYSRGFDTAKDLAGKTVRRNGLNNLEIAAQQEASGVTREITEQGARYGVNEVTRAQAIGRGLLNPLTEGHEEMAQKVIQTWAGNRVSNDDPDTYYKALIDPEHRDEMLKTNSALGKAIVDTWGNIDNWEEFAIGALTGALGMPTFGKVNNSGAETYLGKGKTIGISGGIGGAIRGANIRNQQAREAADVMNKYMEKLAEKQNYFVQSSSYTDAMDGYAAENNRFEWNNAKDNDDFAAAEAFSRTGHLNDLRDMVNQDFENISDEELQNIALNTSSNVITNPDGTIATHDENGNVITGQWRNADGTLMSSTEEGRAKMREELAKKRDSILNGIDEYVKSVTRVRGIANGSLSESQIQELAWLHWKGQRFKKRYQSIKADNDNFLQAFESGIEETFNRINRAQEIREELQRKEGESISEWNSRLRGEDKRGRSLKTELNRLSKEAFGAIDPSDSEQSAILKQLSAIREFFRYVKKFDDPEKLGAVLNTGKNILDALQNDALISIIARSASNLDNDTFNKGLEDLQDIAKIGAAAKTFQDRYQKFIDNPLSQQQNRDRLDAEAQQDQERKSSMENIENVKDMSVKDLREEAAKGNINLEDLANNKDLGDVTDKAKEALDIDKKIDDLSAIIESIPDLDEQVRQDAQELLNSAGQLANTVDELVDLETEAYQDINNLPFNDMSEEELNALADEAIAQQEQELQERHQKALEVLANAKNIEEELQKQQQEKPQNLVQSIAEAQQAETEETGHDKTPSTPSVQQQKAQQQQASNQGISVPDYVQNLMTSNATIKALPEELKEPVKNNLTALLAWVKSHNQTDINTLLNQYIKPSSKAYNQLSRVLGDSLDSLITDFYNESKRPATQQQFKVQEPRVLTTNTDPDNLNNSAKAAEEYSRRNAEESSSLPPKSAKGLNRYWRRNTPSYIIDKTTGKPVRYESTTQRDIAVVNYHEKNGTFDRIDRGEVQEGDEVFYIIDDALNEQAGEIVILMAKKRVVDGKIAKDSDGNPVYDIIGDVSSKDSQKIDRYEGLKSFIERVEKEYEEFKKTNKDGKFVSKETNHVSKLMSGYITYTENSDENRLTLNEIFENKSIKLGVAVSDGSAANSVRIKPDDSPLEKISKLEDMIIRPISSDIKKGQPFLLIETGNNKRRGYITIPISMPRIQAEHSNKGLYKSIEQIVEAIVNSRGNTAKIVSLKDYLLKFVNIPNIFFEFDSNGDLVKVSRAVDNTKKIYTTIEPSLGTEAAVKAIMKDFEGLSYRIDRQMFGHQYNGQDYNSMVGELAETNLPKGFTHTIGNWFVTNVLDANGNEIKAQAPRSVGNTAVQQKITNDIKKNLQHREKLTTQQTQSQARSTTNQNSPQTLLDNDIDEILIGVEEIMQKVASNDLEQQAKDRKLFTKFSAEKLWKAMSTEEKEALLNVPDTKIGEVLRFLGTFAFDSKTGIFKTNVLKKSLVQYLNEQSGKNNTKNDSIIRRLRSVTERQKQEAANIKKELNIIAKALPQLSRNEVVRLHKGLIKIGTSESSEYAWGKFQDGISTLSDVAARGTLYHESFHFVFNSLLTDDEVVTVYNAAREVYGNKPYIELEENLAEDFRRYMQFQEELEIAKESGNIQEWNRIKSEIKSLLNKLNGKTHILNNLFSDIYNRKYAERVVNNRNAAQIATEREMQEIRQDAIARGDIVLKPDGSFDYALAPNGNRSNLNERQWLQVRTKNFIRWFGNWIGVNKFNKDSIDTTRVDVEETENPNEHEGNKTLKIYIKGQHDKGWFELVKDREFGQYSVHLKTDKSKLEKGDTKILFEELAKAIPDGAIVSTWGSLTEDGVRALNDNIGRGMTKIGERKATLKSDGSNIVIPIYQKGEGVSKVVDENGEPLVVYHTTHPRYDPSFTVFDIYKEGKRSFIYTTDNVKMSESYAPNESRNQNTGEVVKKWDKEKVKIQINKDKKSIQDLKEFIEKYNKANNWKEYFNNESIEEADFEDFTKQRAYQVKEAENGIKNLETEIKFLYDLLAHPEKMEYTKALFVNIKTPFIMDAQGNWWNELNIHNGEEGVYQAKYMDDKKQYERDITQDYIIKHYGQNAFDDIFEYDIAAKEDYLTEEDYEEINKIVNSKYPENYTFESTRTIESSIMEDNSYDGMIIKNVKDYGPGATFIGDNGTVIAAKNSNQIKSATDNVGTFSEDDDIRYRKLGQEDIDKISNQISQTTNDLNKSMSQFNTRLNQVKEKYDKAVNSLNKRNKLTIMGKDYYYIDTGDIVNETTKSPFLVDRDMEDFGQVIAHNNHWTIIIPIINNKNDLIPILEEKDITFKNLMEEIDFYDNRLSTLQLYRSEAVSQLNDAYSRTIKSYRDSKMMYDMLDSYGKSIIKEMGFTQESWDESLNSFDRDNIGFCRL